MSALGEVKGLKAASKLEHNKSGRRIFFRFLKGMAIAIPLVLVLSVIAFYAYENHIGEKAWLETKAKYEQQGFSFDLNDFVPEMPPEEENFARCWLIRSLTDFTYAFDGTIIYDDPMARDSFLQMDLPQRQGNPGGKSQYGLPIDFQIWINSFHESEEWNSGNVSTSWTFEKMQSEMEKFDSIILIQKSKSLDRPFNQLPIAFGDTVFDQTSMQYPYASDCLGLIGFIRLRTNIAIEANDAKFALLGIQLMLRIADTLGSYPEYIHNLVSITVRDICLSSIWHGIENQLWTDEQLSTLQTDLITPLSLVTMGKAFHVDAIISYSRGINDFLEEDWERMSDLGEFEIMNDTFSIGKYGKWYPTGWWNQNRAIAVTKIFENVVIPLKNGDAKSLVNYPKFDKTDDNPSSHIFYYSILASSYDGVVRRNLEVQTKINLAIAACAVERFHLRNNRRPDSITELKAANLGEIRDDFYNPAGVPLQYRKDSDNGRYLLYSYGTNQKDNGGIVNPKPGSGPFGRVDKDTSDIVWRYSSPKILKLKALFDSGKWKPTP